MKRVFLVLAILGVTFFLNKFPVGAASLTRTILQPSDDHHQVNGGNQAFNFPIYLGRYSSAFEYQAAFRFTGINIPRGANIESAKLILYTCCSGQNNQTTTVRIYGEKTANSEPASQGVIRERRRTDSSSEWVIPAAYNPNRTPKESPNLAPIISEIVNLSDWDSGNHTLTFILASTSQVGYLPVYSFEGSSLYAARLEINYSAAAIPTATPTPTLSPTPTITPTPTVTPPSSGGLIDTAIIGYNRGGFRASCSTKIIVKPRVGASIDRVLYYIDEQLVGTENRSLGVYTYYWNSFAVSDGRHRFKVVVFSQQGEREEKSVDFEVRNAGLASWWQTSDLQIRQSYGTPQDVKNLKVLMLHYFSETKKDEYTLTYDQLYCLLTNLESSGYQFVNLGEFYDYTLGRRTGGKPVLLVIDDGSYSQYEVLTNIIPLFGGKALLGIPTGLIEGETGRSYLNFSASDLAKLARDGYDLGSHSVSHTWLTRLTEADLERELVLSKQRLEEISGREVFALVYPYGTVNDFVREKARSKGYRLGFIVNNYWRSVDFLTIWRVFIKGAY